MADVTLNDEDNAVLHPSGVLEDTFRRICDNEDIHAQIRIRGMVIHKSEVWVSQYDHLPKRVQWQAFWYENTRIPVTGTGTNVLWVGVSYTSTDGRLSRMKAPDVIEFLVRHGTRTTPRTALSADMLKRIAKAHNITVTDHTRFKKEGRP